MKDEKKVKATEEVKKEVQTEEEGVQLTDEELSKVSGGERFPIEQQLSESPQGEAGLRSFQFSDFSFQKNKYTKGIKHYERRKENQSHRGSKERSTA